MSRLQQRVQRLESTKAEKRLVMIYVGKKVTEDESREQHFAEHPEDRNASHFLFIEYRDPRFPDTDCSSGEQSDT